VYISWALEYYEWRDEGSEVKNKTIIPMNLKTTYQNLVITSFGAGLALLCMLLISVFADNHITQQHFELLSSTEIYSKELLESADTIKAILSFDNIFIVLYIASFTFLYMVLSHTEKSLNILIGLVAVLGTGFLDFYENHHIMSFINMVQKGISINQDEIVNQMTMSQLKFHLSYLSFFLMGFSLPTDTFLEKFLKYSLLFLQLPVGVLVYTAPESFQPIFTLARYIFMFSGLMLISYNFYLRRKKLTLQIFK
jgi:hypothetical protein